MGPVPCRCLYRKRIWAGLIDRLVDFAVRWSIRCRLSYNSLDREGSSMPIYEYVCDDCGAHYERIVMSQQQSITCPKCESAKHTIQLSVFAAPANGSKASGGSSSGPASGSGGSCC